MPQTTVAKCANKNTISNIIAVWFLFITEIIHNYYNNNSYNSYKIHLSLDDTFAKHCKSLILFWLMQSLATFVRACLRAWQWQMSMQVRSKQLPDLHGGRLVFISGRDRVNAGRWRFTVMCRRGTPDRDAAHVRLQLTPGQATERLIFFTTHR